MLHLKLPIGVGNKINFNEPYLQLIKARIIFQRFLDLAQCTELVILDVDRALVSVDAVGIETALHFNQRKMTCPRTIRT